MKYFLKILNPIIWIINIINYQSHLENQRFSEKYTPYDFNKDKQYF